jgi:hypothetical protein
MFVNKTRDSSFNFFQKARGCCVFKIDHTMTQFNLTLVLVIFFAVEWGLVDKNLTTRGFKVVFFFKD